MAGVACLGSLIPPHPSSAQIPPILLAVGLDVGKKLFDMGIDYAKGAVLSDVFKEPTLGNVHEWVSQAVTSIEARIDALDAKIDQQNLNRMMSDLDSIREQFEHYSQLPPRLQGPNRYLLAYCDTTSGDLLSLSQKYEQAFFLSSTVLAYRLLTRFALFQLDSSNGANAEGHITSLVPSMKAYFEWATDSRSRLVSKLAPHYKVLCKDVDKGGLFTTPKTACDIFRGEALISKTKVMNWAGKTEKHGINGYSYATSKNALDYLNKLPALQNDWRNWRNVNRKSGEQIELAATCMSRMYLSATTLLCPLLLDRQQLMLKNTSTLQYSWEGNPNWRNLHPFNP